jgi:hypothetical protein
MEHEDSLPCSQQHLTGPRSEPDRIQATPYHPIFLRFILILSPHQRLGLPSRLLLLVLFSIKYILCTSHLSHACYMPRPSHPPWLDQPNKIWWSLDVVKLLIIVVFSSLPQLPLRSKNSRFSSSQTQREYTLIHRPYLSVCVWNKNKNKICGI